MRKIVIITTLIMPRKHAAADTLSKLAKQTYIETIRQWDARVLVE